MLHLVSYNPASRSTTEQRIIRMRLDLRVLRLLTTPEIVQHYQQIEWMRDELSKLLDRADDKD
jgi:hypothetical protein